MFIGRCVLLEVGEDWLSSRECPQCSKSFISQTHLRQHVESRCTWPDDSGNNYVCPKCTKQLDSATELLNHLLCHKLTRGLSTIDVSEVLATCNNADANDSDGNQAMLLLEKSSLCEKDQVFQCHMCPRSYETKIKYQKHISYHKKRHHDRLHCSRCSQFFCNMNTWRRHENIHRRFDAYKSPGLESVRSIYLCSRCDRVFDCQYMLERHEKNHVEVDRRKRRVFRCLCCSRSFLTSALRDKHQSSHDDRTAVDNNHICQFCNKRFLYQFFLYKHIETAHCNEDLSKVGPVQACSKCSQVFFDTERLRTHEMLMHNQSDAVGTDNMFKCVQCSKSLKSRFTLKLHMSTHSGDRPYQCRAGCSRRFAQHSTRAFHERTHSDATPHICPHCGLAFKHSTMLRLHSRLHTGFRPHQCPSCPRTFHRSSQLVHHARIHTSERPYVCAACPKQFSLRSQLVRHDKAVHRQLKPWRCQVCDKTFSQPGNLRIHMRVHTQEKPFTCDYCNTHFSYLTTLKSHMRLHQQTQLVWCANAHYCSHVDVMRLEAQGHKCGKFLWGFMLCIFVSWGCFVESSCNC